MRVEDGDLVYFLSEKFLYTKFGNILCFENRRRILELEIRQQLALGPSEELPCFSTGAHVDGFLRFEGRHLAHQVCV